MHDAIPHCTFVTGPSRSGRARYIRQRLSVLRETAPRETPPAAPPSAPPASPAPSAAPSAAPPAARAAVLVIDDGGPPALRDDAAGFPGARVNKLTLPCLCCPELAGLPAAVRSMCGAPGGPVSHLFIKIPDIAAPRLLAEFDRAVGWPRTLVVCLGAGWARVRAAQQTLPLFLSTLLALADEIITPPADTAAADENTISLTL
jgi:hypothetical protein